MEWIEQYDSRKIIVIDSAENYSPQLAVRTISAQSSKPSESRVPGKR